MDEFLSSAQYVDGPATMYVNPKLAKTWCSKEDWQDLKYNGEAEINGNHWEVIQEDDGWYIKIVAENNTCLSR